MQNLEPDADETVDFIERVIPTTAANPEEEKVEIKPIEQARKTNMSLYNDIIEGSRKR